MDNPTVSSPLDLEQLVLGPPQATGPTPRIRALSLAHGATCARLLEHVRPLYDLARAHGAGEAEVRETALQVVAFGGFPSAIAGLEALGVLDDEPDATLVPLTPPDPDTADRLGRATFAAVYRDNTDAVLEHLDDLVPGFSAWVLHAAYGSILSRPTLDLADRELLAVSALALMGLSRPLESHIRGALHNGSPAPHVDDILLTSRSLATTNARSVIDHARDRLQRRIYSR